jgi:hypothetical protein
MTGGNDGKSRTQSESRGTSRGWNEGRSDGVSHGTSRSQTDGTSETSGTSTSETEGTTRGTSQSRSSGMNETIQKRALVTPDEIGQIFARVKDRDRAAYPGLALVVISGARPVALRRVNYYEDFQFMGLFDPHPDHPFLPGGKELTVDAGQMAGYLNLFEGGLGLLRITAWPISPGQMVAAGDAAAVVVTEQGTSVASIRVPRAGMITAVAGGAVPQGRMFSLRYFEDGAAMIDPFSDLAAWREAMRAGVEKQRAELVKWTTRAAIWMLVITAPVASLGGWVAGEGAFGGLLLLGAGIFIAVLRSKSKEMATIELVLKKYAGQ